jgi:hypothetical protein
MISISIRFGAKAADLEKRYLRPLKPSAASPTPVSSLPARKPLSLRQRITALLRNAFQGRKRLPGTGLVARGAELVRASSSGSRPAPITAV